MRALWFVLFVQAAWTASQAAYQRMKDFERALEKAGVPKKVAALHMGLSESQLSHQLACRQPMNAGREADLWAAEPNVERAFLKLRAERGRSVLLEDERLTDLVHGVEELVKQNEIA